MSVWGTILRPYFIHHLWTIKEVRKVEGRQIKIREESLEDISILWIIPTQPQWLGEQSQGISLEVFWSSVSRVTLHARGHGHWQEAASRERQSQVALAGATIPHPTCTWPECPGISCDELWVVRVKTVSLELPKNPASRTSERSSRPAAFPEAAEEKWVATLCHGKCGWMFSEGSPKNYKRGSFDHLQNTKRRRLKLLPNSQKEPPPDYVSGGACSSPSTCSTSHWPGAGLAS